MASAGLWIGAGRAEEGFDATLPEIHAVFVTARGNLVSGEITPPVDIIDIDPLPKHCTFNPGHDQ